MSTAAQACVTCRKQKRKCDKLLPQCSRCASLQRICDYSEAPPAAAAVPTADDFAALQRKLVEIEDRLNARRPEGRNSYAPSGSDTYIGNVEASSDDHGHARVLPPLPPPPPPTWTNRFPSALFLDNEVYRFANTVPPKPEVDIPLEVLDILSSSEVVQEAVSTYFNTIHKWFSFISRKRMNLGISLAGGGPDLALLFLAIMLITTPPPAQTLSADQVPLYWTTKRFLQLLEAAGTTSILYLQSLILIALYEYSHSIYPSAYLSIGACVRYASLLGLPSYSEASAVLGPCTTWTETEERRRTWWAVHILDRIVSLGSKRPFASGFVTPLPPHLPHLPSKVFLPTDDAAWDAGDMARAQQRPLGSTPVDEPTHSPFARLAQAAVLVSKAMAHCHRAAGRWDSHHYERPGAVDDDDDDDDDDDKDTAMGEANTNTTTTDDNAKPDARPVNIRKVTALLQELSALCKACQADMARAGAAPGTDAYFGFLAARCVGWSTSVMVLDMYSCPEHMRPGGAAFSSSSSSSSGAATTTTRAASASAEQHGAAGRQSAAELAFQMEAINGLRTAGFHVRDAAAVLLGVLEGEVVGMETDSHLNNNNSNNKWTSRSMSGGMVNPLALTLALPVANSEGMAARISPLCLDAIYCAMSTFGWLWRESGDADMKEGMEITGRCLERIGTRWRLAGVYLELCKRQDGFMMDLMGLNGAG